MATLRPASGHLAYEFTDVRGVRELPDGRIIVVDRGVRAVLWVDPSSGRTGPIGRQGEGPGEYRYPAFVVSLGLDSSLVVDTQLRRWILLAGDRVVRTMGPDNDLVRLLGVDIVGADRLGRVASLSGEPPMSYVMRQPTSAQTRFVVTARAGHLRLDTIGTIRVRRGNTIVRRGTTAYFLRNPLAIDEQSVLMRDGWLAVARTSPYRVDWVSPAGVVVAGAHQEVMPRVTEAYKQSAIAREWLVPGYTGPVWVPTDFPEWPAEMPPFLGSALMASPEGQLLVERSALASSRGTLVDVFDRSGSRVRQLQLPARARIVGFGERRVYVAQRNDDDLETLSIHPWP
ncbi:MAG: hypothetical protein IT361_09905 [Gemmatimonadaceae bacterium]|nr:hypothetical protein [Gemmatimonadaceae bacterium]